MDKEEIFVLRDAFPPPYASRCKLVIGIWKNAIQMRDVEIIDLGFLPLVRTIRQGDALFNSETYDRARDFYLRQLHSGAGAADIMELRHKIGMTYLRQGVYSQAREWLEKVVTLPEKDFWAQQAGVALLEISWRHDTLDSFLANLQNRLSHPALQNGVRQLLRHISQDLLAWRGFYESSHKLNSIVSTMEKPGTIPHFESLGLLAASLRALNRYCEAENVLRRIVRSSLTPEELVLSNLRQLADVFLWQGKIRESLETLDRISSRTHDQAVLAHCEIYRAFGLRAMDKLPEATALLSEIAVRFPKADDQILAFAQLQKGYLLCMAGKIRKAEKVFEQAKEEYSRSSYFRKGSVSANTYLTGLLTKEYMETAQELSRESRMESHGFWETKARQAVIAGVFFELGGETAEAKRIWKDTVLRFPLDHYAFYGPLAQALLSGNMDGIENIPYPNQTRSEIFYLIGLFCEARKQNDKAQSFFLFSSEIDPSLRWPAFFAKEKLAKSN